MSKILFIIPARSSSKRVKNKNIRNIGKSSLIENKIKTCLKTKIGDVVVTTDSKKIANVSKKIGAKVPFLRPKKYSTSTATMMSSVLHLLRFLKDNSKELPGFIAIMPPTYPFISPNSIKRAFTKIKNNNKLVSICAFSESNEHPYSYVKNDKKLKFNILKYAGKKLLNYERTQDYPKAFVLSGAIRISRISYFLKHLKNKSSSIKNYVIDFNSCLGFKISKREAYDINDKNDFNIAKFLEKNKKIFK